MRISNKYILILVISTMWVGQIMAQEVEHNFLVGPQYTDCDSLDFEDIKKGEAIEIIKASKFRYTQNFKLTRKQGLMGGNFYSCDNQTGFLIIIYENLDCLYFNISKDEWEALITSKDPEGYYLDQREKWPSISE